MLKKIKNFKLYNKNIELKGFKNVCFRSRSS